jgi:hypothetical protein
MSSKCLPSTVAALALGGTSTDAEDATISAAMAVRALTAV